MNEIPHGRRFDLTSAPEATPPFVLWTIPHACPMREFSELHDVQATERLLRAARCVSDAIVSNSVFGDVVLASRNESVAPLGFSMSSALEPLGGLSFIQDQCRNCPANALQVSEVSALAGCVGFIVPDDSPSFYTYIQQIMQPQHPQNELEVSPRLGWHSLWLQSELSPNELHVHLQVFEALAADAVYVQLPGIVDFLAALRQVIKHQLTLVVRAFPAGRCEGRRWHIPAHCRNCLAAWPDANRQHCSHCGQQGGRQSERTRRRMGIRPYRLLSEFLSAGEIAELMEVSTKFVTNSIPPTDSNYPNENLPNLE